MSETMTESRAQIRGEVLATPEGFCLRDDDGELRPIRLGGAPVREFLPGWVPLFVYSAFPGLHLLELQRESRQRATWFLDDRLERLGDAVKDLPPHHQARLIEAAGALRADLWVQLMLAARPTLSPATRAFFHLNEPIREQILAALQQANPAEPTVIDLAAHAEPTFSCSWNGGEAVLRREHLEALFAAPIKDRFIEACATGRLTWPSPVDGAPMRLLGGLFLDDFRFAYRMLDEASGLVVVLMVGEHLKRTLSLVLPQAGIVLVRSPASAHASAANFGQQPAVFLERHIWRHALSLERYFQSDRYGFASFVRGRPGVHLGHLLWNELSPIGDVVRALPAANLPLFMVPNAPQGVEAYGQLDALFPEILGRVKRFEGGIPSLIAEAYAQKLCVTQFTDIHVSSDLRRRIVDVANASRSGLAAHVMADAISEGRLPIIVIGLRVENRTIMDLGGFLIGLIERMVQQVGPAVFVIDGHNRRLEFDPDSTFESHAEVAASRRPVDVERDIAARLQAHFAGTVVRIVSTIGATVQTTIAWSSRSRMFFAIWGAGLAKYRWVANLPGFVLSSAWNLRQRGDLHIYDSEQFMDTPTAVTFADPATVTDRPDHVPLIVVKDGSQSAASYANFDVDMDALWPQVSAAMARFGLLQTAEASLPAAN